MNVRSRIPVCLPLNYISIDNKLKMMALVCFAIHICFITQINWIVWSKWTHRLFFIKLTRKCIFRWRHWTRRPSGSGGGGHTIAYVIWNYTHSAETTISLSINLNRMHRTIFVVQNMARETRTKQNETKTESEREKNICLKFELLLNETRNRWNANRDEDLVVAACAFNATARLHVHF